MIQPLRNFHRRIIYFLAILLPILFSLGLRTRHRWPARTHSPQSNSSRPSEASESETLEASGRGARQ